MAFTYDLSTSIGKMRLLLKDTDSANPIYQDAEYTAFYDLSGGSELRGAGMAIESAATNTNLRSRVVAALDVRWTDPARQMAELMSRAERLYAQADAIDAQSGGAFDWAELVTTDFSARERLNAELLRSGA